MKIKGLLRKQWPRIKQLGIYFNLYSSGIDRKKIFSFPYQLRFSITGQTNKLLYIDMLIKSLVHITHT